MRYRDTKGRYAKRPSWATFLIVILLMTIASVYVFETTRPQPEEMLVPVVDEPELTEREKILSGLNEMERRICERFPITECRIALAVQQSENGEQNPEATYVEADGDISVGVFQIKEENWDTDACPYGLHELTAPEQKENIECGYNIWDRCDGEMGNNKGCWREWGTWHNGRAWQELSKSD